MVVSVYIAPHEREEAIAAYANWLTSEDAELIRDAPEDAPIRIDRRDYHQTKVTVL